MCRCIDVALYFGTQKSYCWLSVFAAGDDDVGVFTRRGDKRLMHRPYGCQVLCTDRYNITTSFLGVAQDAPEQTDVVWGINKHP